jgi:hypothetical protein
MRTSDSLQNRKVLPYHLSSLSDRQSACPFATYNIVEPYRTESLSSSGGRDSECMLRYQHSQALKIIEFRCLRLRAYGRRDVFGAICRIDTTAPYLRRSLRLSKTDCCRRQKRSIQASAVCFSRRGKLDKLAEMLIGCL